MKKNFLINFLLFVCLIGPLYSIACEHDKDTFKCVKYLKNYDGDTVTFSIPNTHPLIGNNISVRVFGIDTPEIKGKNPCEKEKAQKVKVFVQNKLSNAKKINLTNVKRDKYFRILADIEYDGINLKDELLKLNFGYDYFGKTKKIKNWCK